MSQIEITCIDQTAIFTNMPEIFSGDVNVDTVKFNFDNSWDNYETKTAVFYNNPKETYPVMLDGNNVAVIPKEVMARKSKLSIGVFGTNVNGDVKTSKILTYTIGRGAISDDLGTNSSSMDVWVQLLTRQLYFEDEINAKVETMSNEIDTISDDVDTVEAIAKGRNQALAYNGYSEMITALNSMSADELKRGQNIYIATLGVPDLWVYSVEESNVEYTYVDDDTFVEGLNVNTTVQAGHYRLAQLETQKVDVGGITNDINALQEDVENITPRVETLESRPLSLLCTESELLFKEVECDISLPSEITNDTNNYYRVGDMLYCNNELYMLVKVQSSQSLVLYIHNGTEWTTVTIDTDSQNGMEEYDGGMQELNGVVYIAYSKINVSCKLCKYENGSIVEITSQAMGYNNRCRLIKDYENNVLYWVKTSYYSSSQYDCYYQRYDGKNLGTNIKWLKDSAVYLYGACIKNGTLYICTRNSAGTCFYEINLTTSSSSVRYHMKVFNDKVSGTYYGLTKKICGEYLSVSYSPHQNWFIYRNNLSLNGLTDVFCSGMSFTNYNNGLYICDIKNKTTDNKIYKSLKKIKLYKKLYTYGKQGDILQCGDSFAISDNLEAIDNGYRVTADGNVEIGLYL